MRFPTALFFFFFLKTSLFYLLQVLGKVPTVNIEKTDGCQVYLSKDSLDTSFISAKSSEMNVVIPAEDGDYVSFRSIWWYIILFV